MGNVFKYALISLAALLTLLMVTPFLIPVDSIRQTVEEKASEATGLEVKIGAMSLTLLPTPGLSLSNVTVHDVPGGVARAVIASGTLSVATAPLLEKQVELQAISFNDIDLRISEHATGSRVHVVHIDNVTGSVRLTADQLDMPNWQVQLYHGTVIMNARLAPLNGDKRTLKADLTAEGVQIHPLLMAASGKGNLTGTLSSKLVMTTDGDTVPAMRHNLTVDGPVKLANGAISGMGLEGPAVALVHGKLAGGPVLYDVMQFQLKVRGYNRWLNSIVLQSSHLNATGHVHIAANQKLDGEIQTSGTAGLSGATLLVSGTTDTQRLYPAPSSLIGGTIGSTIAGPVGAAVGSKIGCAAGNAVEGIGNTVKGLFGK